MTKQISLTQGKFAIVDDEDYEWAMQWKWHAKRRKDTSYAVRNGGSWPFQKTIFLHREIAKPPSGVSVDHINGDGLDCRRTNLRPCTHAENQHNSRLRSNNTSGFKGVSWHERAGKWVAGIRKDRRQIHLGYFACPEAAARAYDAAAQKYHGEFARLNFPIQDSSSQ